MTCTNSNMIGLFYIGRPTIEHETGLTGEQLDQALEDLGGIAYYDSTAELAWIPNAARFQLGDRLKAGDNRIKAIKRDLGLIGSHPFAAEFVKRYNQSFCLELPEPDPQSGLTSKGLSEPLSRGSEGTSSVLFCSDQLGDPEPVKPAKRPRKERATHITEDWTPSEKVLAWCREIGMAEHQIESERLAFIDLWTGRGEAKADWDATFRGRIRRATAPDGWVKIGAGPNKFNAEEKEAERLAYQESERALVMPADVTMAEIADDSWRVRARALRDGKGKA
jgi:hypothetical protein